MKFFTEQLESCCFGKFGRNYEIHIFGFELDKKQNKNRRSIQIVEN